MGNGSLFGYRQHNFIYIYKHNECDSKNHKMNIVCKASINGND